MATNSPVSPHIIRTTSRTNRPLVVRISARNSGVIFASSGRDPPPSFSEGPSCIFVGPIETASKETLEALYRQARRAYYSGNPLIVDDMFDRVELKLRWYGSKYVVKYPRCSLKRQLTYADTQEDPSQVFALASVWLLFLGFGGSALLVPIIYMIGQAYQDAFNLGFSYGTHRHALEFLATRNGILLMALGSLIGYPIASAAVGALQGLWKNDLVALKGVCPSCGEEVFAFVRPDLSNKDCSLQVFAFVRPDLSNKSPHTADCHVCESSLEFRTKVEQSTSSPGRRWVHGRIYLMRQRRMSRSQRSL